jgi:hypothetical protein
MPLAAENIEVAGERRRARRPRALLSGKLVFGQMSYSADCSIRDLSDTGARVRVAGNPWVGGEVWLICSRSGVAYRSVVAWRRAAEFGLRFVEEVDLKQPKTGPLYALRRLWLELATANPPAQEVMRYGRGRDSRPRTG